METALTGALDAVSSGCCVFASGRAYPAAVVELVADAPEPERRYLHSDAPPPAGGGSGGGAGDAAGVGASDDATVVGAVSLVDGAAGAFGADFASPCKCRGILTTLRS